MKNKDAYLEGVRDGVWTVEMVKEYGAQECLDRQLEHEKESLEELESLINRPGPKNIRQVRTLEGQAEYLKGYYKATRDSLNKLIEQGY